MKTRARRKNQDCRVYKVKIQQNRLTEIQKEQLKMLFVESKWFINDVLNYSLDGSNIKNYQITKCVNIKLQDGTFAKRNLNYISAQQKQALITEMISNIKTLSTLKKNGYKVGRLKFRSEVNSIPLKQNGNTHKIISNKKNENTGR